MANPQWENGYIKISSELWEALCKIRISGEARQMLDVIIRKTYGYNKKEDSISTSQFIEFTGLPNYAVHKARKKLIKMNLITITQKGNSQVLTYSFQKDYEKWIPITQKGYSKKGIQVSPKKVTNYNPKGDTQYIINNITKDNTIVVKSTTIEARDYFYNKYKEKTDSNYVADFAKDGRIFKELLKVIEIKPLNKLIDKFFDSTDSFILSAGFTVGVFKTQINKLQTPEIYKYMRKE